MKLVFTKSNLSKAVGIVMKAVPTRTTMTTGRTGATRGVTK